MLLTIITINRNNASGLANTLRSIESQTYQTYEHIIIDGASTDNSPEVIKEYAETNKEIECIIWISEPDQGIYNAMNKGIQMASGKYIQFLNSGDCLASDDVTDRMLEALRDTGEPSILYGNMLKNMPSGKIIRDRCFAGSDISFLGFYTGALNHSPSYIRKDLFDKYGMYDESLKIVSDWKWYLKAIILGGEKPIYTDIDVTLFDMHGISETNKELDKAERKQVLADLISPAILADYERWSFPIEQMKRLKRHPWAYKMVWFIERCLFKIEKFHQRRSGDIIYK